MSKKTVERRSCDQCGKTVEQEDQTFGGSPFSGWYLLKRTDGSTAIPRRDNGPWDFCNAECLQDFLNGLKS